MTPAPIRADVERLVVVCPSWVGDTVMATPVLRLARRRLPGAWIIAAVRRGLDDLLRGLEEIDDLLPLDMSGLTGPWSAARALARRHPQAALLLPNSFRSALTVRLSRTAIRAGYRRDGRGGMLTHALDAPRSSAPTPAVEYYARLAQWAFGVEDGAQDDRTLHLAVTDEEQAAAETLLGPAAREPYVLLNPGGNDPAKRWPAARFAAVADRLHQTHGLRAVASGAPSERKIAAEVAAASHHDLVDLTSRGIDLGSLKAIIARAALVITNDTGPRHIAAALGTPVVSLFGPTDHRWTTLECPRERIVLAEPFLPEELVADRHPKLCTIDRIAVADVCAAADALLG